MIKLTKFDDEMIYFSDGSTISYHHDQDCCECNYADFSALENYKDLLDKEWDDFTVGPIDGTGIMLTLIGHNEFGIPITPGILIPCYSEQNGYYSTDLDILVNRPDSKGYELNLECEERVW